MAVVDDKFVNIKDLRPGMKNVTCVFIVIDKGTTNQTKDGNVVRKGRVADRSGSIYFSLWNEQAEAIESGDILKLTKGYVAIWKEAMTLYSGKYGRLEKIGDFTMVFSELPDMSDPNQEFILQYQRQNSSTVAGNSKFGPNRGGNRMGPGGASRPGHNGTRPGSGGGTRTGYEPRLGPGVNGTRMGPSGLTLNRNGNNQMGMAVPTSTPTHIHGTETVGVSTSPAPVSRGPLLHSKMVDSNQPSPERIIPPNKPHLKQGVQPTPFPNHRNPPPDALMSNPRHAHLNSAITTPAQPAHHPTFFQPGQAPQHPPRQQIPNIPRPPGPLSNPHDGYSPQRGMLLQPHSGGNPQFRPRPHQQMHNFPGTGPNIRAPNPPSIGSRYQPYPPCRPPPPERHVPPGGWR